MPIKGTSDVRYLPRLGKIHLGDKVPYGAEGKTRPRALDYFLCPEEVQAFLGEKPTELTILLPSENPEIFASQYLKYYSNLRGLVCKGDGETADALIDTDKLKTEEATVNEIATRESTHTQRMEIQCLHEECPMFKAGKCGPVMCLQFMIAHDDAPVGIYQLDTRSWNNMVSINSCVELIRHITGGTVSGVPLKLTLKPKEVTVDGKKKTVKVLDIRIAMTMGEALAQRSQAVIAPRLAITAGAVEAPPSDEAEAPEMLSDEEGHTLAKQAVDEDTGEIITEPAEEPAEKPKAKPKAKPANAITDQQINAMAKLLAVKFGLELAEVWTVVGYKDGKRELDACHIDVCNWLQERYNTANVTLLSQDEAGDAIQQLQGK
jgi:hypothetical protein